MQNPPDNQLLISKTHRVITGGFGVLFIALVAVLAVWSNPPLHLGAALAAVVIGALGFGSLDQRYPQQAFAAVWHRAVAVT